MSQVDILQEKLGSSWIRLVRRGFLGSVDLKLSLEEWEPFRKYKG